MNRNKIVSKRPGDDFTVEYKSKRKAKLSLNPLPAESLHRIIAPLAEKVPSSQPVRYGEVLPAQRTDEDVRSPDDYIKEINRLYAQSQSNFMRIGALLDKAKTEFSPEDYRRLINSDLMPFDRSGRSQILQAYRAIKNGIVSPEMADHGGYSTVYLASKLTDEQRHQAIEEGILRHDTKRHEIVAFQRRLRSQSQTDNVGDLTKRMESLVRKRGRLLAEVEQLNREIQNISEKISLDAVFS